MVAVFGGEFSLDLEAWNPEDGTVTTLATLPSDAQNRVSSQLISINGNTELLMFGGYSAQGSKYHNDIWKYSSATNSWIMVSQMTRQKSSFVILPVKDSFCNAKDN